MLSRSRPIRLALWLVLTVMLGVRLGDAHLHLCFDGQKPPASVHVDHASGHDADHHQDTDECHADKDVSLLTAGFFKEGATDIPGLLVTLFVLFALMPVKGISLRGRGIAIHRLDPPDYLRPPLRGPPR
jgi:hypothetical protein